MRNEHKWIRNNSFKFLHNFHKRWTRKNCALLFFIFDTCNNALLGNWEFVICNAQIKTEYATVKSTKRIFGTHKKMKIISDCKYLIFVCDFSFACVRWVKFKRFDPSELVKVVSRTYIIACFQNVAPRYFTLSLTFFHLRLFSQQVTWIWNTNHLHTLYFSLTKTSPTQRCLIKARYLIWSWTVF